MAPSKLVCNEDKIMIITESPKLFDSALFSFVTRSVLCDYVTESNIQNKKDLKNFILKEATDYEIMNILLLNKIPKESSNLLKETALYSILKEQMVQNCDLLVEHIGHETFNNILFNVSPLSLFDKTPENIFESFLLEAPKKKKGIKGPQTQGPDDSSMEPTSEPSPEPQQTSQAKEIGGEAANVAKSMLLYNAVGALIGKAKDLAAKGIGPVISLVQGHPIMAGATLAAILGYAAIRAYQNHFSAAAKQCEGSDDKAECMKFAKIQALGSQINDLRKGLSACKNSKDPKGCQDSINKKIQGVEEKISKARISESLIQEFFGRKKRKNFSREIK